MLLAPMEGGTPSINKEMEGQRERPLLFSPHSFLPPPDDHTRVRLRAQKGAAASEQRDDYINANFVDGFRTPRAYIGTQGPTRDTFAEFWRMTWEQNARVIVMITHLFENGKPKCDLYWPDAGSDTYGELVVTLTREDVLSSYTLRTFSLRKSESAKEAAKNNKVSRPVGRTGGKLLFTIHVCANTKCVREIIFLLQLRRRRSSRQCTSTTTPRGPTTESRSTRCPSSPS